MMRVGEPSGRKDLFRVGINKEESKLIRDVIMYLGSTILAVLRQSNDHKWAWISAENHRPPKFEYWRP